MTWLRQQIDCRFFGWHTSPGISVYHKNADHEYATVDIRVMLRSQARELELYTVVWTARYNVVIGGAFFK